MDNSAWADVFKKVSGGYGKQQQGSLAESLSKKSAKARMRETGKEVQNKRDEGAATVAAAKTDMAASGIRTDSGSAVEVTDHIAKQNEKDAQQVLLQGKLESSRMKYEGKEAKREGQTALISSVLGSLFKNLKQPSKDVNVKGQNRSRY